MAVRKCETSQGRMVSRDPLGGGMRAPMSQNRYAYAMDNPTTYSDPSGMSTIQGTSGSSSGGSLLDTLGSVGGDLLGAIGNALIPTAEAAPAQATTTYDSGSSNSCTGGWCTYVPPAAENDIGNTLANDAQWMGGTAVSFIPEALGTIVAGFGVGGAAGSAAVAAVEAGIALAVSIAFALLMLEGGILSAAAATGHPITGVALIWFLLAFNFIVFGLLLAALSSPAAEADPVAYGAVGGAALFFIMESVAFGSCQQNSTCWASTGL